MSDQIFPITLPCNDRGWSAYTFQKAFLAAKPDKLIWYGYDTIIHSPTEVEFVTYDMQDNVYGGLGKKTATFKTEVSTDLTADDINRKIMSLAALRRKAEWKAIEAEIISGYAEEIRAAAGLSHLSQERKAD